VLRPLELAVDPEVDAPDTAGGHRDLPGDAAGDGLAVAGGEGRDGEIVPSACRNRDEKQRDQEDETERETFPTMLSI
jgi:hypothetical protein